MDKINNKMDIKTIKRERNSLSVLFLNLMVLLFLGIGGVSKAQTVNYDDSQLATGVLNDVALPSSNFNQLVEIDANELELNFNVYNNSAGIFAIGDIQQTWSANLSISAELFNGTQSLKTYAVDLFIDGEQPENSARIDVAAFPNATHFELTINSYNPAAISILQGQIQLSIKHQKKERRAALDAGSTPIVINNLTVEPFNSIVFLDNSSLLTFKWTTPDLTQSFDRYDLEIVKVEPDFNGEVLLEWKRAISIEVEDGATQYSLLLADGTGYYVARVRPIGNLYVGDRADIRNYGEWSTTLTTNTDLQTVVSLYTNLGLSIQDPITENFQAINPIDIVSGQSLPLPGIINLSSTPIFYYNQFDEQINWIYGRVFTEGARQSETMTIANGLNQVHQQQTKLFGEGENNDQSGRTDINQLANGEVIGTQTVYDYSARGALQTLPSPLNQSQLGYKENFFLNVTGDLVTAEDFDSDDNSAGISTIYPTVPFLASPSGEVDSPNEYYSEANDGNRYIKGNYVPDAQGYPYSRTLFYSDATGRVLRQGGAGFEMRLREDDNDSRNVVTLYGDASQMEMDRLFGSEAPLSETVRKQLTIDPNGLLSFSYIAQDGSVIGTGLSETGVTPSLTEISGAGDPDNSFTVNDVFEPGITTAGSDESTVFKQVVIIGSDQDNDPATPSVKTVGLHYEITPDKFNIDCGEICYTCDYKVTIAITNPQAPTDPERNVQLTFEIAPEDLALAGTCNSFSPAPITLATINSSSNNVQVITVNNTGNFDASVSVPANLSQIQSGQTVDLLTGTYTFSKTVAINNNNPLTNLAYLDEYGNLLDDERENWTVDNDPVNNCCGITIDQIDNDFDCDNLPSCTGIEADGSFSDPRMEQVITEIDAFVQQEQSATIINDNGVTVSLIFGTTFLTTANNNDLGVYTDPTLTSPATNDSYDLVTGGVTRIRELIQDMLAQGIDCETIINCFQGEGAYLTTNISRGNLSLGVYGRDAFDLSYSYVHAVINCTGFNAVDLCSNFTSVRLATSIPTSPAPQTGEIIIIQRGISGFGIGDPVPVNPANGSYAYYEIFDPSSNFDYTADPALYTNQRFQQMTTNTSAYSLYQFPSPLTPQSIVDQDIINGNILGQEAWSAQQLCRASNTPSTIPDDYPIDDTDVSNSDIITICEERCDSNRQAFAQAIRNQLVEYNVAQTQDILGISLGIRNDQTVLATLPDGTTQIISSWIDPDVFDFDTQTVPVWQDFDDVYGQDSICIIDGMVAACKSKCELPTLNAIDQTALINEANLIVSGGNPPLFTSASGNTYLSYTAYINSDEHHDLLLYDQQCYEDAFLGSPIVAPFQDPGAYSDFGDQDIVQTDIIRFINSSIERAFLLKKSTGSLTGAPSPSSNFAEIQLGSTTFSPTNLLYRQQISPTFYIADAGLGKEIKIVTNVIWESDHPSTALINEGALKEVNIAFYCSAGGATLSNPDVLWAYQPNACNFYNRFREFALYNISDIFNFSFDNDGAFHAVLQNEACGATTATVIENNVCTSNNSEGLMVDFSQFAAPTQAVVFDLKIQTPNGFNYIQSNPVIWQVGESFATVAQKVAIAINGTTTAPNITAIVDPSNADQLILFPGATYTDPVSSISLLTRTGDLVTTSSQGACAPSLFSAMACSTQAETFTSSCPVGFQTIGNLSGVNLVPNGDFELGPLASPSLGFTSDYTYDTNPNGLMPGEYSIVIDPQQANSGFVSGEDNTTGSGYFLIADANNVPNMVYIQLNIPVQPFSDYEFSAFIRDFNPIQSNPKLVFTINGEDVGSLIELANPNTNTQWIQFAESWNSGGSSFATIGLKNLNTSGGGSDFGLDDIFFGQVESACQACLRFEQPEEVLDNSVIQVIPANPLTCEEEEEEYIAGQIDILLDNCLATQLDQLETTYRQNCLENITDEFSIDYELTEHHYTLYYYDRAGNLTKTVPPSGTTPLTTAEVTDVAAHRNDPISNAVVLPLHANIVNFDEPSATTESYADGDNLTTRYEFNSIKQLIEQETPDGGISKFFYNAATQLVLSQDAQQAIEGVYAYTRYDRLGRIVEVGELTGFVPQFIDNNEQQIDELWLNRDFPYQLGQIGTLLTGITGIQEAVYTTYTTPSNVNCIGLEQRNIRNRISKTETQDGFKCFYSYDEHGNVEWLLTELPEIGQKTIQYEYDLISGNVLQVMYQKGQTDQFFHKYEYDADNRITNLATSTDGSQWTQEARYDYYVHGPLLRAEIGNDNLQGFDYTYTIEGFLKTMNQAENDPSKDPGRDGNEGSTFLPDEFAMELGYYNGDYTRSGTFIGRNNTSIDPFNTGAVDAATNALYNGNIAYWMTNTRADNSFEVGGNTVDIKLNRYKYDQLNRIKAADYMTFTTGAWNNTLAFENGASENDQYDSRYNYDGNGNLVNLLRKGTAGNLGMDDFSYNYAPSTEGFLLNNRLSSVADDISLGGNYDTDIDNQGVDNYTYDAEGNLISDEAEGILQITWNLMNKVESLKKRISKDPAELGYNQFEYLWFEYDAMGNRSMKLQTEQSQLLDNLPVQELRVIKGTYYYNDASGNTMAIYNKDYDLSDNKSTISLIEQGIYGSERIGQYRPNQVESIIHGEIDGNGQNYDPLNQLPNMYNANFGAGISTSNNVQFLQKSNNTLLQWVMPTQNNELITLDYNITNGNTTQLQAVGSVFTSTHTAVALKQGKIEVSAAADQNGNWQFYDANYTQIPNGLALSAGGGIASPINLNAAPVFVSEPGTDNYYFFYTTVQSGSGSNLLFQLNQVTVNPTTQTVSNSVVVNTDGPIGEKLLPVQYSDGNSRLYYNQPNGNELNIQSLEITSTGVSAACLITKVDALDGNPFLAYNDMAISPDGKRFAVTIHTFRASLLVDANINYDVITFDITNPQAGTLEYPVAHDLRNSSSDYALFIEFSPQSQYLYATGGIQGNQTLTRKKLYPAGNSTEQVIAIGSGPILSNVQRIPNGNMLVRDGVNNNQLLAIANPDQATIPTLTTLSVNGANLGDNAFPQPTHHQKGNLQTNISQQQSELNSWILGSANPVKAFTTTILNNNVQTDNLGLGSFAPEKNVAVAEDQDGNLAFNFFTAELSGISADLQIFRDRDNNLLKNGISIGLKSSFTSKSISYQRPEINSSKYDLITGFDGELYVHTIDMTPIGNASGEVVASEMNRSLGLTYDPLRNQYSLATYINYKTQTGKLYVAVNQKRKVELYQYNIDAQQGVDVSSKQLITTYSDIGSFFGPVFGIFLIGQDAYLGEMHISPKGNEMAFNIATAKSNTLTQMENRIIRFTIDPENGNLLGQLEQEVFSLVSRPLYTSETQFTGNFSRSITSWDYEHEGNKMYILEKGNPLTTITTPIALPNELFTPNQVVIPTGLFTLNTGGLANVQAIVPQQQVLTFPVGERENLFLTDNLNTTSQHNTATVRTQIQTYNNKELKSEIRRAANGNLYINRVPTVGQATNLEEYTLATNNYSSIPLGATAQYGLPLQPFKNRAVAKNALPLLAQRTMGKRVYENKDHLGNVRVVISDRRLADLSTTGLNDQFGTNITGWTATGGATLSHDNTGEKLVVTTTNSSGGATKIFTTTIGTTYNVSFNIGSVVADVHPLSSFLSWRVGPVLGAVGPAQGGIETFTFVATSTSTVINISGDGGVHVFTLDDVIITEQGGVPFGQISYSADVQSWNDYYAFGSTMPGRSFSSLDYRYGFNGMEKDDDIKNVGGSSYDFGARFYDSRLGRWLTRDPYEKKYIISPYAGIGNNPIIFTDPSGERIYFVPGLGYNENSRIEGKENNPYAEGIPMALSCYMEANSTYVRTVQGSKGGRIKDMLYTVWRGQRPRLNVTNDKRAMMVAKGIATDINNNPIDRENGEQMNIVATSQGSVSTANAVIAMLESPGEFGLDEDFTIDNLVLAGSPIDPKSKLYKKLRSLEKEGKIKKIRYEQYQHPDDKVSSLAGKSRAGGILRGFSYINAIIGEIINAKKGLPMKDVHVRAAYDKKIDPESKAETFGGELKEKLESDGIH